MCNADKIRGSTASLIRHTFNVNCDCREARAISLPHTDCVFWMRHSKPKEAIDLMFVRAGKNHVEGHKTGKFLVAM